MNKPYRQKVINSYLNDSGYNKFEANEFLNFIYSELKDEICCNLKFIWSVFAIHILYLFETYAEK